MKVEVSVEALFITETRNTTSLKNKLVKMLRNNDFDEKNFEIGVKKIRSGKANEEEKSSSRRQQNSNVKNKARSDRSKTKKVQLQTGKRTNKKRRKSN